MQTRVVSVTTEQLEARREGDAETSRAEVTRSAGTFKKSILKLVLQSANIAPTYGQSIT